MIHDVDETLRALIRRDVVNGSGVDISFEAPTKEWAAKRTIPTVNVYLYDIREETSRRDTAFEEVRDETGRVVARRQPPRRFRLSYLLTAWTQRPEDEHRLLALLLGTFLKGDLLPEDVLAGSLRDAPKPTICHVALPPPEDRSISDVWSALGGELKPSLDLVVIAPFDPQRSMPVGPPVTEEPRIRVASAVSAGGAEEPKRRHKGSGLTKEQDDAAAALEARQAAEAEALAASSGAVIGRGPGGVPIVAEETLRSGADNDPGRVLEIRQIRPKRR